MFSSRNIYPLRLTLALSLSCGFFSVLAPQSHAESARSTVQAMLENIPGFADMVDENQDGLQATPAILDAESGSQAVSEAFVSPDRAAVRARIDQLLTNVDASDEGEESEQQPSEPLLPVRPPTNAFADQPEIVASAPKGADEQRPEVGFEVPVLSQDTPGLSRLAARNKVEKMVAGIPGFEATEKVASIGRKSGDPLGVAYGDAINEVGVGGGGDESESTWGTRYVLGVGDEVAIGLHGRPSLTKTGVAIGPDGTLSFLQAKGLKVIGLTIDEVRTNFEEELSAYHREPRVIISPSRLASKRYTILGAVEKPGSYVLDRPVRLIEVIAQSGGFPVAVSPRGVEQIADLTSAFVMRNGQKLSVDFGKLYFEGDMRHNIVVEPEDYIYIASRVGAQVYVFGAVRSPGEITTTNDLTLTGAVAAAGGFGPKAWKRKALIVRGRLDQPERFVVNLGDVLGGERTDRIVQPGDIVYIHTRPWAFAEDILDAAIRTFIGGAATGSQDANAGLSVGIGG